MIPLVYFAIPAFIALVLLERAWLRRSIGDRAPGGLAPSQGGPSTTADPASPLVPLGYFGPDTRASLLMGLGNVAISALVKVPTFGLYFVLYEHRVFDPGTGAAAWIALFFFEDFVYYWWHRASHEIRFLWSAHVNHHSSEYFNLSTALRQSWTTPFTVPFFYAVLPLAGFHPAMIATQISISLIYQFWIHTETIDRMPRWFELVFNTPSHHRVHHGANVEYLDRNHAGILIVWDRLFGSFAPERDRVVYGLTKNLATYSPWRIAFHDWIELFGSLARPAPLANRLAYALAAPGWSPDGSTRTAAELRAEKATGARAPVAPSGSVD